MATTPENAPVETEWYGWQTLLVDGAALGAVILGAASGNGAVEFTGFGLYALGPPAVHIGHLRAGVAVGDLFLRIGAPFLIGLVGLAIDASANPCPPGSELCFPGVGGLAVGALVGYVTVVALDAAVLAREPIAKKPEIGAYKLRWTPMVGATPNRGWNVGIGAVF